MHVQRIRWSELSGGLGSLAHPIGEGSAGQVYRGRYLHAEVAVKVGRCRGHGLGARTRLAAWRGQGGGCVLCIIPFPQHPAAPQIININRDTPFDLQALRAFKAEVEGLWGDSG
jgi:hypothetical protein